MIYIILVICVTTWLIELYAPFIQNPMWATESQVQVSHFTSAMDKRSDDITVDDMSNRKKQVKLARVSQGKQARNEKDQLWDGYCVSTVSYS